MRVVVCCCQHLTNIMLPSLPLAYYLGCACVSGRCWHSKGERCTTGTRVWVGSQSRNFRETRRERERERGGEKKETAKIQNKPSTKGEHDSKKTEEVRKRDAVCLCCFYFVHCFINVVKLPSWSTIKHPVSPSSSLPFSFKLPPSTPQHPQQRYAAVWVGSVSEST